MSKPETNNVTEVSLSTLSLLPELRISRTLYVHCACVCSQGLSPEHKDTCFPTFQYKYLLTDWCVSGIMLWVGGFTGHAYSSVADTEANSQSQYALIW